MGHHPVPPFMVNQNDPPPPSRSPRIVAPDLRGAAELLQRRPGRRGAAGVHLGHGTATGKIRESPGKTLVKPEENVVFYRQ